MSSCAERIVLVGGHESSDGTGLQRLVDVDHPWLTAAPGRSLASAVETALAAGQGVTVVPMTFGLDPTLIAETAKTLRWIRERGGAGVGGGVGITLAQPFGTTDHLIAHLRGAAVRLQRVAAGAALVITAAHSDNFNDAEVHRVAHLVRVESATPEVAVALQRPCHDPLPEVAERLRRLGYARSGVIAAGFNEITELLPTDHHSTDHHSTDQHSMIPCGRLMTTGAIQRIVAERVAVAQHAAQHGHDGIDPALNADHDHGYAHSHNDAGTEHGHTHSHAHSHHASTAGKGRHGFSQTAV